MRRWIDYLENEEGKSVIAHAHGLIAYNINGPEVYVTDFYVDRSHRREGIALYLAKKAESVAIENGCKTMTCNIFINKNNRSEFGNKVRLFSEFGFLPVNANNNVITMVKEIQ